MNHGLVNANDYGTGAVYNQAYPGQAPISENGLRDVVKALEATQLTGQGVLNSTTASGAPLKVESLDKTLKHVTFKSNHIKIWRSIPKMAAYNTVEEFNQLTSYGSDNGGFHKEGELPQEEDTTYVRRSQLVKYLGVTKSVTHPLTLVTPAHGPIIQREIQNGTLYILRKLNRSLAFGDSGLIQEEFNGLYAQHYSDEFATLQSYLQDDVVIDLRGSKLTEPVLEQGANVIEENFGVATEFFAPPKVLSDFVTNFYSAKFIQPNTAALTNATIGQRVNTFASQFGDIQLTRDIFLQKDKVATSATAADSSRAPSPPVAGGTPVAAVAATAANTQWGAGDAGDYYYAVAGFNRFGKSQLTVLNSGGVTSIVANGAADLSFSAGTGSNATTGYIIYRSNESPTSVAAAKFYPLFKVSETQRAAGYDGGAAGIVRDLNNWLPETNQAFLIENNVDVWGFRQLAPLMKMDLAIVSPAFRFMVLHYGTLLLYAPRKCVRFINIGTA